MKLNLTIDIEVTDAPAEDEAILDEIVAEEARAFAETVRQRLAAEGITNIEMNVKESST